MNLPESLLGRWVDTADGTPLTLEPGCVHFGGECGLVTVYPGHADRFGLVARMPSGTLIGNVKKGTLVVQRFGETHRRTFFTRLGPIAPPVPPLFVDQIDVSDLVGTWRNMKADSAVPIALVQVGEGLMVNGVCVRAAVRPGQKRASAFVGGGEERLTGNLNLGLLVLVRQVDGGYTREFFAREQAAREPEPVAAALGEDPTGRWRNLAPERFDTVEVGAGTVTLADHVVPVTGREAFVGSTDAITIGAYVKRGVMVLQSYTAAGYRKEVFVRDTADDDGVWRATAPGRLDRIELDGFERYGADGYYGTVGGLSLTLHIDHGLLQGVLIDDDGTWTREFWRR